MDCKSLMIGDWYQWHADGKYYQYQIKPEDFTKDYVENFEPVLLTPEILEKNGWVRNNYIANGYWYPSRETFDLSINDKRGIDIIGDCPFVTCMYVHELQQALRVDGNEDLAENFKIE